MMIRVDNGGTCEEVALTRLAQPDVAASWGKPFFCTALVHPWKLGIYWVPGHGAAADIDGIQIWAKGRAGPGIDRGMFLGALKGWRCAQTIINRFTPCNNSMTYDGPRRLAPERAKLWPESSLQRHVRRSTDLKVTLVPSPRSGS